MSTCPYCGNNPTSHTMAWAGSSFLARMNPLHQKFGGHLQALAGRVTSYGFTGVLHFFRAVGLARWNTDPELALSDRARVLWDEALARGIDMNSIVMLGKRTDAYRADVGGRRIYFTGIPRPIFTDSGNDWWLDDKYLLKQRLGAAEIPVARGGSFSAQGPLEELFASLDKPVIVKPRLGSRGRHTTTHVYTIEELRKAFKVAKQLCHWVMMEEHLTGAVYRATMIDGKLAGVLAGEPPRVTGDGVHTIAELVALKNASKHEKVSDVVLSETHAQFLARTGRTFKTIPANGEVVDLLEKVGVSYGGHSAEVTDVTHPEIKRIMEAAAVVAADPVIGFDFIIPDITKSPHEQKWGVIECNTAPFINLHHDPVAGEPVNVASLVWDYVEKNIDRF